MTDFLGNEIRVGSRIVYACGLGRSSVLVHAEVLELRPGVERGKVKLVVRPLKRPYNDRTTKDVGLQFPERCAVVG